MVPLEVDYSNSFFLPLIGPVICLVQKIRQVKSAPRRKRQIHQDLNHQPPDLIRDALDHRTTAPFTFFVIVTAMMNLVGDQKDNATASHGFVQGVKKSAPQ